MVKTVFDLNFSFRSKTQLLSFSFSRLFTISFLIILNMIISSNYGHYRLQFNSILQWPPRAKDCMPVGSFRTVHILSFVKYSPTYLRVFFRERTYFLFVLLIFLYLSPRTVGIILLRPFSVSHNSHTQVTSCFSTSSSSSVCFLL